MIFQFRMVSPENEDFFRDFEIREGQTFFEFHCVIQAELGYDEQQLASFFLSNKNWEKGLEITLIEMDDDPDSDAPGGITMDMATLSDYVTKQKQHLLYVYDFFSERAFFIELTGVREDNTNTAYPLCINRKGDPPQQIVIRQEDMELDDTIIFKDDFDLGDDDDDLPFDDDAYFDE